MVSTSFNFARFKFEFTLFTRLITEINKFNRSCHSRESGI